MSLEFKLDAFEGPLDLLLLLIEKEKVDIYDIPIAKITDQYMEYVAEMEAQNLDTLSDFLVLAATLLDIKSRMLLPKEEDENGEEIDPRTELVEQLIQYQEFKLMARELGDQYEQCGDYFYKNSTIPKEVEMYRPATDMDELLGDVTLERLQSVFEMVMKKHEEAYDEVRGSFGTIEKDRVRISEKLEHVLEYGKKCGKFSFRALLSGQPTKTDIVVTFLACLELIKVGQIKVRQDSVGGEIELEWNDECDVTISKEDIEQYD